MYRVDISRLKKDMKFFGETLTTYKKEYRKSGREITWKESADLGHLRWKATMLYTFRAKLRGKVHCVWKDDEFGYLAKNTIRDQEKLMVEYLILDQEKTSTPCDAG